ncbi:MAG: MMPL family transporter, partial [Fibrobacteraceae bacterium]|nr:MMPL family transporter [Fibrobacteraceae bacterium]
MFSFFAKIVRHMARYPRVILPVCIILALLSTFAAFNLRWELQLNNLLPSTDEVQKSNEIIEKKFGGLGSLTMVITSPDSAKNHQLAHHVYSTLQQDTMIHFIEYETDLDFYKKHQLLYIDEKDLDTVLSRIEKLRIKQTMEENPFYVNILDSAKETSNALDFFKLDDLEKKYFEMLSTTHSNNDGTIRVLDIYPSFTLSNLPACRKLLSTVEKTVGKADGVKIYYTGKVYNVIQTGRHLLPEAKRAGLLTALFILVLLIIHFYRQPQLIFISALPIGVPILCTLGLAYLIYGRINLFTLLLALLLPGQACQIITHILNRYFMERTRKLSPALSIESALLGIGPSTAVSAFLMASLFFIVSFVPLAGLQELGVLGSIGSVLNWVGCTLLTTSLLQLMQKNKPFKVNFVSKRLDYKITLLSYKTNWIILATISVVSLVGLLYGSQLSFLYDFKKTEMQPNNQVADSLIAQTGFHQYDPIIVLLPNAETGEILQEDVKKLKANKTISKIDRIYT